MYTIVAKTKTGPILFVMTFLFLAHFTLGQADKEAADAKKNEIVIKNFHFDPQVLTVKSGEKITWINRDEEPHLVVSVESKFKKSGPLDTDQEFTITAGAPGTCNYFCSIHPKMTGKIVVEK